MSSHVDVGAVVSKLLSLLLNMRHLLAVTFCEWASSGFALYDQKCPVLCPLLTLMACWISVCQQLIHFPKNCWSAAALCCSVVLEVWKTFLQTSFQLLLCIHLHNETHVTPKTLGPQVTARFSHHLCMSKELTVHGKLVERR
jgi:hypothetical protein